jgi:hypothetical protein
MRFLAKHRGSEILAEGIVYNKGGDNFRLREMLLTEQCRFCAYTEKRVDRLDAVDVEHFDKTKKGNDDYFNYYAVLHSANVRKRGKEKKHTGAAFFDSLFFQNREALDDRIRYIAGDSIYEEVVETDEEAAQLIDFLGVNDSGLHDERVNHIFRLKDILEGEAQFNPKEMHDWFVAHPEDLSFVTAVENEIGVDFSDIVKPAPTD